MTRKQEIITRLFKQDLINLEEMMILLETEKEYIFVPRTISPLLTEPMLPYKQQIKWPADIPPYNWHVQTSSGATILTNSTNSHCVTTENKN